MRLQYSEAIHKSDKILYLIPNPSDTFKFSEAGLERSQSFIEVVKEEMMMRMEEGQQRTKSC